MSKMGEELDKRLDENKYEMLEALQLIRRCIINSSEAPNILQTIASVTQDALSKVEGK